MILLTVIAGTITHLQASNAFGPSPSYNAMPPLPGQTGPGEYTATASQLAEVRPLVEAFSATNPQSVTIPADLVSVIQKITYLAQISEKLGMLPIAYNQIEWCFNGPELQQAMAGNADFTKLFNTYIALNQEIMNYDQKMGNITHEMKNQSDIATASAYFTTNILNNRLQANILRTQLQTMFKTQNPDFENLIKYQQETENTIGQWVDAIMQTASAEKKTQVKTALKTAVQNVTTTPAAAKAIATTQPTSR